MSPTKLMCLLSILAPLSLARAQEPDIDIESFTFDVVTIGDGKRLTQDDFKDKVLIVDLWGTWCPPCQKAIPVLRKLHETYASKGLAIVGLCYEKVAADKASKVVADFAKEKGIPYPLALGTEAIQQQIPDYQPTYPTMLLFRRGLVFDQLEIGFGDESEKKLNDWVRQALEPEKPEAIAREFTGKGGGKLTIGDGKTHTLVALVHPRARPTDAEVETLRQLAAESGGHLQLALVTRDDLEPVLAALPLGRDDLALLWLGKAFPAYVLYGPTGLRSFRLAGSGLVDEVVKRTRAVLSTAEAPKKEAGPRSGDQAPLGGKG
jgi:thiol-disulfide isomerase/thioredoxin